MAEEKTDNKIKRVKTIIRLLKKHYPDAKCSLNFKTTHQLMVATILSAQCTDERVNKTTPALFKKYKVDAGLGINVTPDGKYTVDMQTFMAGKETAYNIIKKKADARDPEAKKDLEKINEYYRLMDGIIRGSQNPGPSLNKMTSNAGGGKATPSGGKNKAVYDQATGRFTYK